MLQRNRCIGSDTEIRCKTTDEGFEKAHRLAYNDQEVPRSENGWTYTVTFKPTENTHTLQADGGRDNWR